jgi:adenine-specific DNA-methyltransferase
MVSFQKTGSIAGNLLGTTVDYLLWYAKNKESVKYRQLYLPRTSGDPSLDRYDQLELEGGTSRRLTPLEIKSVTRPSEGRRYELTSLFSDGATNTGSRGFAFRGLTYEPKVGGHWKTTAHGLHRLTAAKRIEVMGTVLRYRRYADDFPLVPLSDRWESTQIGTERLYVVQTATTVAERCLLMTTDPGDLVIDPTCGSGTTAYVAEQWGRRWITIDTSRVAIALARTRLMAAKFPYYRLADSPEGQKREMEATGAAQLTATGPTTGDIKRGFVYKRVPHIMLKSIANNEDIDAIHAKWQERFETSLSELNRSLEQTWEEWQVPHDANPNWPAKAQELHAQWWQSRRERQREIDASIAKRADTELLYDQPYEDNKRIRVTGPFTVESLSPHRVLSTDEERPCTEVEGQANDTAGQFETMILENLKTAGVQNRIKQERLKFDRLEPFAGTCLHAAGEYTENGKSKRVVVYIGPQYGTVSPEEVKEAAKEAVQGVGYDLLIVCGFAFDPHVSEEVKRYGKLTVLPARMNPDLAMGDTLLKKTGAGNLFMVFGEPDLDIAKQKDGKLVVTIKGVDVYDPTTGEIRSNTTDDIACWFIDTDYNGESFFVRHAYFTGAEEPYEKLKRALRAEVDEAAWSALYSTTSYPFDPPKTGKIAVKVINHYGDEVLKVYGVAAK